MTARDMPPGATCATRPAAMWGLPDWRDPAAYGDAGAWTLARWRWEFTRRRDDYRSETLTYLGFRDEVEAARKCMKKTPTPDAKFAWGTLSEQAYELWMKHWGKWGYSWPLDPRVSEYPHDDLLRWDHHGVFSMAGSPKERGEYRNRIEPKPDELAIIINMDRPIAPQLKLAARAAKRAQKKRHGRLLQERQHTAKWLRYLRTLDAREDGASWAEIAALQPSTAQTEQSARDVWNQARALCFNF